MPKKYDVVSISDLKRLVGLIELRALFAIRDYYDTSKGSDGVATMTNKLKAIVDAHAATTTITTLNGGGSDIQLSVTISYPALPFTVTTDSAGRPTVTYINGQTNTVPSEDYFDFNNITIILNGSYIDGSNTISYEQKVLSPNDKIAQFIVNRILKTSYANLADYIHKHDVIDFYRDYTNVLSNTDAIVVNGSACTACVASCADSCGNGCANACSGNCISSCIGNCVGSCSGSGTCGNCDGRCQGCSGWGICTPCTGSCGNNCGARCGGCANSCGGGCSNSCGGGCYSACADSCGNCTGSCINLHSGAATQ